MDKGIKCRELIERFSQIPDLILLSCLHNIWQFPAVVFPPSCQGFIWSAPILMTAIVIQHNFIENHSTTDEVPSERAGVNLDLSEDRWLD